MNYSIYVYSPKSKPYYKLNIEEFEKRLSRYCKTKLYLLKKESDLKKYDVSKTYSILIDSDHETMPSTEFATLLNQYGVNGVSDISFFINLEIDNPDGFLSISSMDMNPMLTAGILYEQIYRSYRILNNQPYHK